jgi:hypothetical protein
MPPGLAGRLQEDFDVALAVEGAGIAAGRVGTVLLIADPTDHQVPARVRRELSLTLSNNPHVRQQSDEVDVRESVGIYRRNGAVATDITERDFPAVSRSSGQISDGEIANAVVGQQLIRLVLIGDEGVKVIHLNEFHECRDQNLISRCQL